MTLKTIKSRLNIVTRVFFKFFSPSYNYCCSDPAILGRRSPAPPHKQSSRSWALSPRYVGAPLPWSLNNANRSRRSTQTKIHVRSPNEAVQWMMPLLRHFSLFIFPRVSLYDDRPCTFYHWTEPNDIDRYNNRARAHFRVAIVWWRAQTTRCQPPPISAKYMLAITMYIVNGDIVGRLLTPVIGWPPISSARSPRGSLSGAGGVFRWRLGRTARM